MKNLFTSSELHVGMFIIRNDAGRPFKDLTFARTVVYKIGFISNKDSDYGLCSVLTDGWFCPVASTLEKLAEYLNADDRGYRPLTKDELIELVNSSNQGFY